MNEHEKVRRLLPLSLSDDLAPEDLERVRRHCARCDECRQLSEDFASLAGTLRRLPTPQPRAELVGRVLELAGSRLVQKSRATDGAGVLAPLVAAAWIMAVATWPVVRTAVAWGLTGWHMPGGGFATALAAYSSIGLLLACISAVAVGRKARDIRRVR